MTEHSKKQMDGWRNLIKKRNALMELHFRAKTPEEAQKHLAAAAKFDKAYATIPQNIRLKLRSELGI